MPTVKDLAEFVLSNESGEDSGLNGLPGSAIRSLEKLRVHLSVRLGSGGYHALLKRAVVLAAADFPWLRSVHITEDGVISGLQEMIPSPATSEGCVAVLVRLIELLDTFIGRNLTVRVLHNAWPHAIQIDAVDWQGENNE